MNITLHKPRKYSKCTKRWVRPSYLTEYSRRNPYNSGYCEDQKLIQRLIETTTYTIFIFSISFDKILDTEVVPAYVWMSMGALGFDSSEWKSKFCEYIK